MRLCKVEAEEEKRCNMYRRTDVSRGFQKGLKRGCKCCYFNPKGPVLTGYSTVFLCVLKEMIFSCMDSGLR